MKIISKRSYGIANAIIMIATVVVIVVAFGAYLALSSPTLLNQTSTSSNGSSSSSTTSTTGKIIETCTSFPCVQGSVSVGPLCPVEYASSTVISGTTTTIYGCGTNTVVSVTYSQYYLLFSPRTGGTSQKVNLNSSGYYAIAIASGNYSVTMPNCPWMGCSQTFPTNVTILGNQITVLNFTIDTGIR
jgi:hypothetical protein